MIEFLRENKKALKVAVLHTIFGASIGLMTFYFVLHEVPFQKAVIFVVCFALLIPLPQHIRTEIQREKFKKLSEDMHDLVCRDPLTNAATRRFFFERMHMTPRAHGAVLMVDIDHFKHINDSFGHLVGDIAIRTVAETLTTLCRGQDLVCRFGGEEFVIVIYEVDPETALGMAEILRECVAAAPIEHEGGMFFATASIGLAMKDESTRIDTAIHYADIALYKAKEGGRNQCVVFEPEMAQAASHAA